MKKLTKILTLVLVIALSLTMVACSSYKKVEKALVNIGYETIQQNDTADKMKDESDVAVKMHLLSKGISVVCVFEFKATDDMIEYYKDSNTMQGFMQDVKEDGSAKEFYDDLVEKGLAKGNCLVLCLSLNPFEAKTVADAIKNA